MRRIRNAILALLAICMIGGIAPAPALAAYEAGDVSAKYAVLMELESGAVLFEKSGNERAYPASTTKIMTCILALEEGNLDDIVTVPSVTTSGSNLKIRRGETLSLRSLMYGMMLVSGNDCAEAIAAHIGGSKSAFVDMMNAKARELGMTGTHFAEPSGLHQDDHYSTAEDMAILTRYAMKDSPSKDDFRAIVKRTTYEIKDSSRSYALLENTNKLIYTGTKSDGTKRESFEYRGAIGVKTGSTPNALRCLVAAAERDGVTLIAVLLGDEPEDTRFKNAGELFDWGFQNFTTTSATNLGLQDTVQVAVKNQSFEASQSLEGGLLTLHISLAGKNISIDRDTLVAIQSNPEDVKLNIIQSGEIIAPIQQGDKLADVVYTYNGKELFTAEALASQSVAAMGATNEDGTTPPPSINRIGGDQDETGPWLFIILVLVGILFGAGVVMYLRTRGRRRRYGRKRMQTYRGRR